MRRSLLASLLLIGFGCAHPTKEIAKSTRIQVVGPDGAWVSGYYVQAGRRVSLSAPLPFAFSHDGLTEIALFKDNPNATLTLAAQTDVHGWHSEAINEAGHGVSGLRVRVDDGLTVERIKP
jgi:hypothetical protein